MLSVMFHLVLLLLCQANFAQKDHKDHSHEHNEGHDVDECFWSAKGCQLDDSQYVQYNVFNNMQQSQDCQHSCLTQNEYGSVSFVHGKLQKVYCVLAVYNSHYHMCKLYYQPDHTSSHGSGESSHSSHEKSSEKHKQKVRLRDYPIAPSYEPTPAYTQAIYTVETPKSFSQHQPYILKSQWPEYPAVATTANYYYSQPIPIGYPSFNPIPKPPEPHTVEPIIYSQPENIPAYPPPPNYPNYAAPSGPQIPQTYEQNPSDHGDSNTQPPPPGYDSYSSYDECYFLRPGCYQPKSDDHQSSHEEKTKHEGSAKPHRTATNRCFGVAQQRQIDGNAILTYTAPTDFDGSLAACLVKCRADVRCLSLNYYPDGGESLPAQCIFHDTTCSNAASCSISPSTDYYEKLALCLIS